MKLADQSKRHSRMIKEKMQRDVPAAPASPMPAIAAEGRRTVMRSIKLSKGWGDESPEWQAMLNKEVRDSLFFLFFFPSFSSVLTLRVTEGNGGKGGGRAPCT